MNALLIKYGLGNGEPTPSQANQWKARTEELVRAGLDPEAAGHKAASEIFRSYRMFVYQSQADTVYDLLLALARK